MEYYLLRVLINILLAAVASETSPRVCHQKRLSPDVIEYSPGIPALVEIKHATPIPNVKCHKAKNPFLFWYTRDSNKKIPTMVGRHNRTTDHYESHIYVFSMPKSNGTTMLDIPCWYKAEFRVSITAAPFVPQITEWSTDGWCIFSVDLWFPMIPLPHREDGCPQYTSEHYDGLSDIMEEIHFVPILPNKRCIQARLKGHYAEESVVVKMGTVTTKIINNKTHICRTGKQANTWGVVKGGYNYVVILFYSTKDGPLKRIINRESESGLCANSSWNLLFDKNAIFWQIRTVNGSTKTIYNIDIFKHRIQTSANAICYITMLSYEKGFLHYTLYRKCYYDQSFVRDVYLSTLSPTTSHRVLQLDMTIIAVSANIALVALLGLIVMVTIRRLIKRQQNLPLSEKLGHGEFSDVYKIRVRRLPHFWHANLYALKLTIGGTPEDMATTENEINLLRNLSRHENVVKIEGALRRAGRLGLLMELCANGSLKHHLDSQTTPTDPRYVDTPCAVTGATGAIMTPRQQASFTAQILNGMAHLAASKVLHRDLAARNVLLTGDYVCKIADFGLSSRLGDYATYATATGAGGGKLPLRWMPPEVICAEDGRFRPQSDVWSFGVVVWEVFTRGRTPFGDVAGGIAALAEAIRRRATHHLATDVTWPLTVTEMFAACLREEVATRPSFAALQAAYAAPLRRLAESGGSRPPSFSTYE